MVIRSARTRKIQTRRRRGMVGRAIKIGTGVVGRKRGKEERKMMEMMEAQTRQTAVARAPTCFLTLFTTSSGASTWPWNRHLRSVLKTSSITETNRAQRLHKNGQEGTNWLYIRIISRISSVKYIHT